MFMMPSRQCAVEMIEMNIADCDRLINLGKFSWFFCFTEFSPEQIHKHIVSQLQQNIQDITWHVLTLHLWVLLGWCLLLLVLGTRVLTILNCLLTSVSTGPSSFHLISNSLVPNCSFCDRSFSTYTWGQIFHSQRTET